ncbi:hypothetical protein EUTSA_v10029356mg [Eutrema salsugineum]|uniref:F-box domain-containing protein n=1 Tax=Eutrema salsugineum TaxID=72664 RepID=V4L7F5_EUTSA|nr:putative F-box/kelch-repeat protein At1g61540 [Eutrema salsugineum]ESQ38272.1 hypothetical protein EUTSA_v10029356mg [Eutrema salsugineum]
MSTKARFSAASNGAKPPRKKEKPSPVSKPTSLSSLPYELLLNCIARISRLYYPTLSLVSKSFRSIVASPELYRTRSRLDRTENCLYLCLRYPVNQQDWFTLCRKPDRTVTNESSGYQFIPIPSPCLPVVRSSSIVAVDSKIYITGGYEHSSSSVSVLDCRFNTWQEAPSMRVKRSGDSTASLVDGKIYVAGGCEEDVSSSNWVEVFDPKTQTWENVWTPETDIRNDVALRSMGLGGKLYVVTSGGEFVAYDPKEARWNWKPIATDMSMAATIFFSYGVIGNVLFKLWNKGVFRWYDCKTSLWKILKGIEGLPDLNVRKFCGIVDFGGKMAVLWDDDCFEDTVKTVWCAVIALERRNGDEIWGKVEWMDVVFRDHNSSRLYIADVFSASV